jgi:hypothetical protein
MAPEGSGLLTLDGVSVQMALEGSRRIVWMIIGMIKAHPTKNRMPRQAKSTPPFGCGVVGQHASGGLALPGVVQPAGSGRPARRTCHSRAQGKVDRAVGVGLESGTLGGTTQPWGAMAVACSADWLVIGLGSEVVVCSAIRAEAL